MVTEGGTIRRKPAEPCGEKRICVLPIYVLVTFAFTRHDCWAVSVKFYWSFSQRVCSSVREWDFDPFAEECTCVGWLEVSVLRYLVVEIV